MFNIEFVLQITTTKNAVLIYLTQLIFVTEEVKNLLIRHNFSKLWSTNIGKSFHTTKMNLDLAADIVRAL